MEARSDSNDVAHVAAAAESFEVAEPIDYSEDSTRFINGLEILSVDMADQHYSQIIVRDSGEILVPTIGGFLYWDNGLATELEEPIFLRAISSHDEDIILDSMKLLVQSYYIESMVPDLDEIDSSEDLIATLNEVNYDRSLIIPIISKIYKGEGIYLISYNLVPEFLNLQNVSTTSGEVRFLYDIAYESSMLGYFDINKENSDYYIFDGLIAGTDSSIYRNEVKGDSVLVPYDYHFDGSNYHNPTIGYSLTRSGKLLSFSYKNQNDGGDDLIYIGIHSINSDGNISNYLSWTSKLGEYDRRIPNVRALIVKQVPYQYYHGDPFHPVIELDNGNFLTCFSDSPSRQWVEYNGEEFIDVNGPTVINSELPLSFDYSADKKYLFLFRNEDNALWRYEVVH